MLRSIELLFTKSSILYRTILALGEIITFGITAERSIIFVGAVDSQWRERIKMSMTRIFNSSKFLQPTDGEPIRSIVTESQDAVVVAWYIKPGQQILPHIHPNGQDTWTVLSGQGEYYLDKAGTKKPIVAGDVVVAHTGCVHGVLNNGDEPLVFISVVSPADAGYELISLEDCLTLHS